MKSIKIVGNHDMTAINFFMLKHETSTLAIPNGFTHKNMAFFLLRGNTDASIHPQSSKY